LRKPCVYVSGEEAVGWGGRIRTFNLLIQSNTQYRQRRFELDYRV
jgi:hypothetical protein